MLIMAFFMIPNITAVMERTIVGAGGGGLKPIKKTAERGQLDGGWTIGGGVLVWLIHYVNSP